MSKPRIRVLGYYESPKCYNCGHPHSSFYELIPCEIVNHMGARHSMELCGKCVHSLFTHDDYELSDSDGVVAEPDISSCKDWGCDYES